MCIKGRAAPWAMEELPRWGAAANNYKNMEEQ